MLSRQVLAALQVVVRTFLGCECFLGKVVWDSNLADKMPLTGLKGEGAGRGRVEVDALCKLLKLLGVDADVFVVDAVVGVFVFDAAAVVEVVVAAAIVVVAAETDARGDRGRIKTEGCINQKWGKTVQMHQG